MGIRIGTSRKREPLQVSSMCYVDTDGDREVIPGVEWDMVTKGWLTGYIGHHRRCRRF
jgi:hypothetical protein